MKIVYTQRLTLEQRTAIFHLWNNEYPGHLNYRDLNALDIYLSNLPGAKHYLYINAEQQILGWAFKFTRDIDTWFAIILDSQVHRQGIGSYLLDKLKDDETKLNGWVVDHSNYLKLDGAIYVSPLPFYVKNAFEVSNEVRMETPRLSAIKICWTKPFDTRQSG